LGDGVASLRSKKVGDPLPNQMDQQFERLLQLHADRTAAESDDDDEDGQVELVQDFQLSVRDHRGAAATLRNMAEDAEAGLPRAVLETVADMADIIAGGYQTTRVNARLCVIDWDTTQIGDEMLYMQHSEGRLRAGVLYAWGPTKQAQRSVSVKFLKCGVVKSGIELSSLRVMDLDLVDLPWDYSRAHPNWLSNPTTPLQVVTVPVDGLIRRQLNVRYFSLKKKAIYQHMPVNMRHNKADHRVLLGLFEQQRRGHVVAFKQQKKDGELSMLQQRLLGVHTPASMRAVWAERRMEVHLTLSDEYLKARVSALRRWSWNCITVFSIGPWRNEVWPAVQDPDSEFSEDQVSLGFVTESSMRYTTVASCRAAWTHVKEFHITMLSVMPGPHPLTDHFLKKLRPVLLKENPDGRKDRPGYEPIVFDNMCKLLREYRDSAFAIGLLVEASEYHEVLLASCAFYEPAARAGEFCPGDAWNPLRGDWSKETTRCIQTGEGIPKDAIAVLLPQPHRKTEYMTSRVAQQRAKNPIVYLAEDSHHFLLFRAAQESNKYSPVNWSSARTEPCFRKSINDSTPLSSADIAGYLQAAHAELYPAEAAKCTYALHGARIGRIQSMKAARGSSSQLRLMNLPGGAPTRAIEAQYGSVSSVSAHDEDIMIKVSGHTKSAGLSAYDTSQLADEIALLHAANTVEVLPMDTVHRFARDGSGGDEAVSVVRDSNNRLQVVKQSVAPLPRQIRVFTAGTRTTAVQRPVAVKRVFKSSQAKSAAAKFRTIVSAARRSELSPTQVTKDAAVETNVANNSSSVSSCVNVAAELTPPTAPVSPQRISLPVLPSFQGPASPKLHRAQHATVKTASRAIRYRGVPVRRLCEDCQAKSANYGISADGFVKRWCSACGKKHGAKKPPTKSATGGQGNIDTAPAQTIAAAFAKVRKAE
jgi:hypothetical protein